MYTINMCLLLCSEEYKKVQERKQEIIENSVTIKQPVLKFSGHNFRQ